MSLTVFDRIKAALLNGAIKAYKKEQINEAQGYSLEELAKLGLKEQEIKRLERTDLVVRARLVTDRGHINRWIFIIPEAE